MKIISVRQNPEYKDRAIKYFQEVGRRFRQLFIKIVFLKV